MCWILVLAHEKDSFTKHSNSPSQAILYKTKVTSKPYKTNVQTNSEIVKNSSLDMSKLDIF